MFRFYNPVRTILNNLFSADLTLDLEMANPDARMNKQTYKRTHSHTNTDQSVTAISS